MAYSIQTSSGGYDFDFVEEPPDDLKCLICLFVARDPLQHGEGGCGKIFCRQCITRHKLTNKKCPNCQKTISTFKDERSERDIQSLIIRCVNEKEGCTTIGELRSGERHFQICGYGKILCPNKCHQKRKRKKSAVDPIIDYTKVYRKDLQEHLQVCPRRQYTCQYCQLTGEYNIITGVHLATCPKLIVRCKHDRRCEETFPRDEVDKHTAICQYVRVPCKYEALGCMVTPTRKSLSLHEADDKAHTQLVMDSVLQMKSEIALLKYDNRRLKKECERLKKETTTLKMQFENPTLRLFFQMKHFAANRENNEEFYSYPFLTHPEGYTMTVCVNANGYDDYEGTHISVWAFLMRGEYDDHLHFLFEGIITFELLNQLGDGNHHRQSYCYDGTESGCVDRVIYHARAERACGVIDFISHSDLYFKAGKNCQYLVDDCLEFRIYCASVCSATHDTIYDM